MCLFYPVSAAFAILPNVCYGYVKIGLVLLAVIYEPDNLPTTELLSIFLLSLSFLGDRTKPKRMKIEKISEMNLPRGGICIKTLAVERLDLSFNKLGDRGASILLRGLTENPIIKRLSIAGNCITSGVVDDLRKFMLSATSLESLDLSYNALTLYGVLGLEDALKENTAIRELNFSYNKGIRDLFVAENLLKKLLSWNQDLDVKFMPVLKVR